jgi:O-antigen/teichoic acid export membrane protein
MRGRRKDRVVTEGAVGDSGAGQEPRAPRASGSLLSGTAIMLTSRLVVAALGWVGSIIIVRELSRTAYGSFAFIFSLLGLLGLIADFETSRVVLTEMGRGGDLASLAGRFLVFRVSLGLVTYLLAIGIVLVGPYSRQEVAGVAIGGLSLLIASGLWALISVCQARLWLRVVAVALVVGQVVQLALIVALHVTGTGSMLRYVVPYVVSDAVSLIVLAIALHRALRFRPRVDVPSWRRWLREAAPLAVGSALGSLYFKIDSVMLTLLLHGARARVSVGTYQVGYKFSDLLSWVAPGLIATSLPLLARVWPREPEEFRRVFRQSLVLVVVIGTLATTVFAALASDVIPLLYTDKYAAAVGPARWLVAGQALNFATQLCYVAIVATGRSRVYPRVTLAGLAVNVGINVIVIPMHREMGAAVATVVTEVIVLALLTAALRGLPIRPMPWRSLLVTAIGAVVTVAAIVLLSPHIGWLLAGAVGVAADLAVLHVLRVDGRGGLLALARNSRIATHAD